MKNFPTEYIYAPWEAPRDVQEKSGCVVGKDYPEPMVDHDVVVQRNKKVSFQLELSLRFKTFHCESWYNKVHINDGFKLLTEILYVYFKYVDVYQAITPTY